jgi:hypothetical protein
LLQQIFEAAAELQAPRWNDPSLLENDASWLKGRDYYCGEGRADWESAVELAKSSWARVRAQVPLSDADASSSVSSVTDSCGVRWSPFLVRLLDATMQRASWSAFQQRIADKHAPFTLTHGDFHCGNMMYRHRSTGVEDKKRNAFDLWLLDWSEVGVFEPTADLGQLMISDVAPALRKSCEEQVVHAYWSRLVQCGVDANEYPFVQCWREYGRSGAERWCWLLPVLASYHYAPMTQYFHDQMLAFVQDHKRWEVTPDGRPFFTLSAVVCIA